MTTETKIQPATRYGDPMTITNIRASEDRIDVQGEPGVELAARYTLTTPPESGNTAVCTLLLYVRVKRLDGLPSEARARCVRAWTSTTHNVPPPGHEPWSHVWDTQAPYEVISNAIDAALKHHGLKPPALTDYQRLHKAVVDATNAQLEAGNALSEAQKRYDQARAKFIAVYPVVPTWSSACAHARRLAADYGFAWIEQNRTTHEFLVTPGAEDVQTPCSASGEMVAKFTRLNTEAVVAEFTEF